MMYITAEEQYLNIMKNILETGVAKEDRTGTGTLSTFGQSIRVNLNEEFPLLTTKFVSLKSIIHELLWFLKGDTNVKYLNDNGVKIWNEWRKLYKGFNKEKIFKLPRPPKEFFITLPTMEEILDKNKNVKFSNENDKKLQATWKRMIDRCYNSAAHNYRSYGAKGIYVDSKWHDVKIFVDDVKKLINYVYKAQNWNEFELDKDYFGGYKYSLDTCIWLHRNDNVHSAWLKVTNKKGEVKICRTYKEASLLTSISKTSISRFVLQGLSKTLKGNNKVNAKNWVIEKAETAEYVYRYELDSDLDLGPVYGKQWTDWVDTKIIPNYNNDTNKLIEKGYKLIGSFLNAITGTNMAILQRSTNQIQKVIDLLTKDPDSRRIYVTAMNVGELDQMALEPCHNYFQFTTRKLSLVERFQLYRQKHHKFGVDFFLRLDAETGEIFEPEKLTQVLDEDNIPQRMLNCFFLMRSSDFFIGTPYNLASYALLARMIAHQLNMQPGELLYQGVDVHLYTNHLEQAKEQLTREPYKAPWLRFKNKPTSIFDYKEEDFELGNYPHHPPIKAPIAI